MVEESLARSETEIRMPAAPEPEQISSLRNPLIKHVRELLRHEGGGETIVIEGLRAIIEAIRTAVAIESILVAPSRVRSAVALQALDQARAQGAQVIPVADDILDAISTRDASQGMLAVARRPAASLTTLPTQRIPLLAVLFEPQDPGNVGTIARTADGAGATALAVCGHGGVDPFHPRAIRASMGSLFALPILTLGTASDAIGKLHAHSLRIVAAAGSGEQMLWEVPLTGPVAIMLGNERTGLPPEVLAACDVVARIPLAGSADSLNVAAAAAVFLFEAVRQRHQVG